MNLSQLVSTLPRPSVILITGRRGSGKDVTACALAEEIQRQTKKEVYSNYNPEVFKLPKGWRLRYQNDYKPNTIQLLSDVHMEYFSREWREDINTALIKIVSTSRHSDIDFIYTTQISALFDRQAVGNVDALLFKEPSALADKFERPELRTLTEEAKTAFTGKTEIEKWETSYVYTHTGTYLITGTKRPVWFTEELSKIYAADTRPFWRRIL